MQTNLQPDFFFFQHQFQTGPTYHSKFEQRFKLLAEEVQKIVIATIWCNTDNYIWEAVSDMYPHDSFHYQQEYILYEVYLMTYVTPQSLGNRLWERSTTLCKSINY